MSLPWQCWEGPTNSPKQSGPLTPGRPLEGVGHSERHCQVWEKLAGWLLSNPSLGRVHPCPIPVPPGPEPGHHAGACAPGVGSWGEVARPLGSGTPEHWGFSREELGLLEIHVPGALGVLAHRQATPSSSASPSVKTGTVPPPQLPLPLRLSGPRTIQSRAGRGGAGRGGGEVTRTEPQGGRLMGAVVSHGERAVSGILQPRGALPPREAPSHNPFPRNATPELGSGTHAPEGHPPTLLGCLPGPRSDPAAEASAQGSGHSPKAEGDVCSRWGPLGTT